MLEACKQPNLFSILRMEAKNGKNFFWKSRFDRPTFVPQKSCTRFITNDGGPLMLKLRTHIP